jgi:transcriptional regulator with XRE-family HTH domain
VQYTPFMDVDNPQDLAAKLQALGLSQPYASQLANRKRAPSLKLALIIEKRLGIPPRFWEAATEAA